MNRHFSVIYRDRGSRPAVWRYLHISRTETDASADVKHLVVANRHRPFDADFVSGHSREAEAECAKRNKGTR